MAKYPAVNKAGWQAFGAIQALYSREAVLKDLTLNELQSLFRRAKVSLLMPDSAQRSHTL